MAIVVRLHRNDRTQGVVLEVCKCVLVGKVVTLCHAVIMIAGSESSCREATQERAHTRSGTRSM